MRSLRMSAMDTRATRYLLQAQRDGRDITPTQLAVMLNVSTAAVTKLIDRLEDAGRLRREAHPNHRRNVAVRPTADAGRDVESSYGRIHEPLVAIVNDLEADDARVVTEFLERLAAAFRQVDEPAR